jgi:mRNA interferase RelE/StbE
MIDSVDFETQAIDDLEVLDRSVRDRILKKINWLAKNFDQITPQALTGNLAGFFKLRVGDYRILYDFTQENQTITIIRVRHRRDVYT